MRKEYIKIFLGILVLCSLLFIVNSRQDRNHKNNKQQYQKNYGTSMYDSRTRSGKRYNNHRKESSNHDKKNRYQHNNKSNNNNKSSPNNSSNQENHTGGYNEYPGYVFSLSWADGYPSTKYDGKIPTN